jgi:hypothetical protein
MVNTPTIEIESAPQFQIHQRLQMIGVIGLPGHMLMHHLLHCSWVEETARADRFL